MHFPSVGHVAHWVKVEVRLHLTQDLETRMYSFIQEVHSVLAAAVHSLQLVEQDSHFSLSFMK